MQFWYTHVPCLELTCLNHLISANWQTVLKGFIPCAHAYLPSENVVDRFLSFSSPSVPHAGARSQRVHGVKNFLLHQRSLANVQQACVLHTSQYWTYLISAICLLLDIVLYHKMPVNVSWGRRHVTDPQLMLCCSSIQLLPLERRSASYQVVSYTCIEGSSYMSCFSTYTQHFTGVPCPTAEHLACRSSDTCSNISSIRRCTAAVRRCSRVRVLPRRTRRHPLRPHSTAEAPTPAAATPRQAQASQTILRSFKQVSAPVVSLSCPIAT